MPAPDYAHAERCNWTEVCLKQCIDSGTMHALMHRDDDSGLASRSGLASDGLGFLDKVEVRGEPKGMRHSSGCCARAAT
jgi:hypothetical protein